MNIQNFNDSGYILFQGNIEANNIDTSSVNFTDVKYQTKKNEKEE